TGGAGPAISRTSALVPRTRADWTCTTRSADDTRSLSTGPRSSSPTWNRSHPPGCSRMPTDVRPVTITDFAAWKAQRRRISMLTPDAFPPPGPRAGAGVDCLLVGDALGTAVQGWETPLRVTLDQIIYHAEMVARAARRALVVADLPFLSYQVSPRQALRSA